MTENLPESRDDELIEFVNKLFEDKYVNGVRLKECFMAAVNTEDFLRTFYERASVQAALHVPEIIDAIGAKAKQGDVDAAKLILEVARMTGKGSGGRYAPQNAIMINISPQEQLLLERDFENGRIVEGPVDEE